MTRAPAALVLAAASAQAPKRNTARTAGGIAQGTRRCAFTPDECTPFRRADTRRRCDAIRVASSRIDQ